MQHRGDRRRRPHSAPGWLVVIPLALLAWLSAATDRLFAQTPAAAPPAAELRDSPPPVSTDDVPAYYFSPLQLRGEMSADGAVADLVAEVQVHVTRDGGWYDVPLKMGQAVITGMSYEGPREPVPREPGDGLDDGLHWLFSGRGVHRLRLNLRVPLRRTPTGANLQLSLPNVPRLFPTQLNLRVPTGSQVLDTARDHQVLIRETPEGETRLVAMIQGNRVDLSWRVAPDRAGTLARAVTAMTLQRDMDRLRLTATQDISTDGRVSEFEVRLPKGFRLISLGGTNYYSHAPLENDPEWVRIVLKSGERPDFQLEWEFDAEFPETGGAISIQGLEVRNAVRQLGTIAVEAFKGYRVLRQRTSASAGNDDVKREDVARVRTTLPPGEVALAFAFVRQPFELSLNIQAQRLVLESRPRAVITTAADGITLDLDYAIRVDAGVVEELRLHWPDRSVHDWHFRNDGSGMQLIDATDAASQFPGQVRKLELTPARDGEFNVRIQFHSPDPPGRFELLLPFIEADRQLSAWVLLRGRDSVEPKLLNPAGLKSLVDSNADAWLQERDYDPHRDVAYLWETPQVPVAGESVLRPQELKAQTTVRLSSDPSGRWRIEQQVDCEVLFGRISEWNFVVPAFFAADDVHAALPGIRARDRNGNALPRMADGNGLRFALPNPTQGSLSVTLEYFLPESGSPTMLPVPIFSLSAVPYYSTQIEFPEGGTVSVASLDEDWQQVSTLIQPVFVTTVQKDQFTARINPDVSAAPQSYTVTRTFARVEYAGTGRTSTVVHYDVATPPQRMALELPEDAEGAAFTWNGERLKPLPDVAGPRPGRYVLPIPPDRTGGNGRLTIRYQRGLTDGLQSGVPLQLLLPALPDSVEVTESWLEIQLPADHCLFTFPAGLTPQFEWRPGLIFQRVATAEYLAERERFQLELPQEQPADVTSVYAFHTIGAAAPRHEFRVIGVWMLILFGSGLTLALAFLLWSAPVTRNVLTVLVIGFFVAAAGVFAAEAVELLLQPVLLGLVAAAVAISMQSPLAGSRDGVWQESVTKSAPPAPGESADDVAAGAGTTQIRPLELQESGSRP